MGQARLLEVFEVVATARGPVPLAEVVAATELPSSTAHRCLRTLSEAGWLREAGGGGRPRWEVTTRLRRLAGGGQAALAAAAVPVLGRYEMRFGESWQLWVPDGRYLEVVAAVDGSGPLRAGWAVGERVPIHTAAAGKALLGTMSDVEVRRLVGAAPAPVTMRTIVDPEMLLVDLRGARRAGYAIARAEEAEGVTSVAAALPGRVAGAVAVTGPSERMDDRLRELGDAVVGAAGSVAL